MRRRLPALALIGLTALALFGCGYGFRGTVSYLPQEIKTVAIPFLKNRTGEPNLDVLLTQALIREFNRSKLLKLGAFLVSACRGNHSCAQHSGNK